MSVNPPFTLGAIPPCTARICVGKEWYRYPSSFFLGSDAELRFIKSGFTGQLPQPFSAEHGTWGTQPGFNDLNREENSRYVSCTSMRKPSTTTLTDCGMTGGPEYMRLHCGA